MMAENLDYKKYDETNLKFGITWDARKSRKGIDADLSYSSKSTETQTITRSTIPGTQHLVTDGTSLNTTQHLPIEETSSNGIQQPTIVGASIQCTQPSTIDGVSLRRNPNRTQTIGFERNEIHPLPEVREKNMVSALQEKALPLVVGKLAAICFLLVFLFIYLTQPAIQPANTNSQSSDNGAASSYHGNPSRSQIIQFYRNEIPSEPNGYLIETILKDLHGNYDKLDSFDNYIQWLFPNRVPGVNPTAPLLTDEDVGEICASPELKDRALQAFKLMLDFYGMEMQDSDTIALAGNWMQRLKQINSQFKYKMIISRILFFLKEIKEEKLVKVWLKFLAEQIQQGNMDEYAKKSYLEYWIKALN